MRANILALVLGASVAAGGCGDEFGDRCCDGPDDVGCLLCGFGGGGGDGGGGGAGGTGASPSFDELYDQGLTRFVDEFDPAGEPMLDEENGIETHHFAVPEDLAAEPRGPLCLRGTEYTVDTREGSSDELVIYLQGGGACWGAFCSAFEETNFLKDVSRGILNPELETNPVKDWDVVYLPYCDGALFAGDVDRILPRNVQDNEGPPESMGYQRGLQNLTAALDIAVAKFPNPSRILLTGISGGGFGTIVSLPLVRSYYPETEIVVGNDSGIGVAKEGDPEFVEETLLAGWNASSIIPASCTDCTSNGHITRYVEWQLAADDNFILGQLSFSADAIISTFFLRIPPSAFTTSLLAETERIATNYEDRYRRFIALGDGHTFLLSETSDGGGAIPLGSLETEIEGVTVLDWFTAMMNGTEGWVNLVDPDIE